MNDKEALTIEEIRATIKAARDSVWVIDETLDQLTKGRIANNERKGNLERNVGHLKIIVADQEIIDSGEDIQDLHDAIAVGEAKLAEDIWPHAA
jgi:DNA/RNA endonuclease YhcR with UshA esterase domain